MEGKENYETQFLRNHLATTPSELLSHYTDDGGFKGIIENKEIWMTNALHLNDSEELLFAFRLARDHARRLEEELLKRQEEEYNLESLHQEIEKTEREIALCTRDAARQELKNKKEQLVKELKMDAESIRSRYNHRNMSLRLDGFRKVFRTLNEIIKDPSRLDTKIYVASFSAKQDHLSQWRGYCQEGGYALMLDYDDIKDVAEQQNCVLGKCLYDRLRDRENDSRAIEALVEKITEELVILGAESDFLRIDFQVLESQMVQRIINLTPFIKHGGFYEEEEWRLVYFEPKQTEAGNKREVFERESKNSSGDKSIIPFIKVSFNSYDFSKLRIMVSPTSEKAKAGKLAEEFLTEKLGIQPNEAEGRVELSEIPYRI